MHAVLPLLYLWHGIYSVAGKGGEGIHHTNINHSNKAAQRRSRLQLIMKARRVACLLRWGPRLLTRVSQQAVALRHWNTSGAWLGLGAAWWKAGEGRGEGSVLGQFGNSGPSHCGRWRVVLSGPPGCQSLTHDSLPCSMLPVVAVPQGCTEPHVLKGWCEWGGEASSHGFSVLGAVCDSHQLPVVSPSAHGCAALPEWRRLPSLPEVVTAGSPAF